jgi:hypothetical protein
VSAVKACVDSPCDMDVCRCEGPRLIKHCSGSKNEKAGARKHTGFARTSWVCTTLAVLGAEIRILDCVMMEQEWQCTTTSAVLRAEIRILDCAIMDQEWQCTTSAILGAEIHILDCYVGTRVTMYYFSCTRSRNSYFGLCYNGPRVTVYFFSCIRNTAEIQNYYLLLFFFARGPIFKPQSRLRATRQVTKVRAMLFNKILG